MSVAPTEVTLRMIEAAALAGGYRALLREHPGNRGFKMLAERHSKRASDFAALICGPEADRT